MRSEKVSTAARANRKTTKPIMERKRRARINACLTELKSMLLDCTKEEGDRHNKMEKADILEMTVKQLKDIQARSQTGSSHNVEHKQHLGFTECAKAVERYLNTFEGCTTDVKKRLLEHLSNCVPGHAYNVEPTHLQTKPASPELKNNCAVTTNIKTPPPSPHITTMSSTVDLNNNVPVSPVLQPTNVMSSVRVIPITVSSGEVAFILPANILGSGYHSNYVVPVYNNTGSQTSTSLPTETSTSSSPVSVEGSPPTTITMSIPSLSRVPSDFPLTNIQQNQYIVRQTVTHDGKYHGPVLPWSSYNSEVASSCIELKSDLWRPW